METDVDALLSHAGFLRSLSRALVTDEGLACDLVQETWVAAVRSPPERPAEARPWLARVLRNTAASFFRREIRQRERERLVAHSEAVLSAEAIAERESVARCVADAVFALDEPYRTTILLRFYEDLKPGAIARHHGVSVETVRTRLRRGLARLRTKLEATSLGRREGGWVPAVAMLVEPMSRSITAASTAGAGAAAGASATTAASLSNLFSVTALGGALMSTKLSILSWSLGAVLAASSGFLWLQLRGSEQSLTDLESVRATLSTDLSDVRGRLEDVERALADARSREVELRSELEARDSELAGVRAQLERARPSVDGDETDADVRTAAALPSQQTHFISRVEEADVIAADLIARGDLKSLWLLAADLLSYGELGYEKIIELAGLLDDKDKAEHVMDLWSNEQAFLGSFFRDLAAHSEDILRFHLHLDGKESTELSGLLRTFHKAVDDDLGVMLFDMYDGRDTELLDTYVERYRRRIADGAGNKLKRTAAILGHIGTEAAVDLLLEIGESAPPDLHGSLAEALAWTRDPAALPLLHQWRQEATDPRLIRTLDAAIRLVK